MACLYCCICNGNKALAKEKVIATWTERAKIIEVWWVLVFSPFFFFVFLEASSTPEAFRWFSNSICALFEKTISKHEYILPISGLVKSPNPMGLACAHRWALKFVCLGKETGWSHDSHSSNWVINDIIKPRFLQIWLGTSPIGLGLGPFNNRKGYNRQHHDLVGMSWESTIVGYIAIAGWKEDWT